MHPEEIFDRGARRLKRKRMASFTSSDRWLIARMAEELLARWQDDGQTKGRFLIFGYDFGLLSTPLKASGAQVILADPANINAGNDQHLCCDEDRLPLRDQALDGIFAINSLDTVHDLPGALLLFRRALKPGGFFKAAFAGAGSGEKARAIARRAEGDSRAISRFHPQIDVRAAGDLLARAGFEQNVADVDDFEARYSSLQRMAKDCRANGLSNVLADRHPASPAAWQKAQNLFAEQKESDGKMPEAFCLVYLSARVRQFPKVPAA